MLYDDPERIRSVDLNRDHAKSASRCPAVLNLESRYFVVKCPFSIHLGFERDSDGKPCLKNRMGGKARCETASSASTSTLVAEPEWRHKDRPTLQIKTPYLFVADEPVFHQPAAALHALSAGALARNAVRRTVSDPCLAAPAHVGLRMARPRRRT